MAGKQLRKLADNLKLERPRLGGLETKSSARQEKEAHKLKAQRLQWSQAQRLQMVGNLFIRQPAHSLERQEAIGTTRRRPAVGSAAEAVRNSVAVQAQRHNSVPSAASMAGKSQRDAFPRSPTVFQCSGPRPVCLGDPDDLVDSKSTPMTSHSTLVFEAGPRRSCLPVLDVTCTRTDTRGPVLLATPLLQHTKSLPAVGCDLVTNPNPDDHSAWPRPALSVHYFTIYILHSISANASGFMSNANIPMMWCETMTECMICNTRFSQEAQQHCRLQIRITPYTLPTVALARQLHEIKRVNEQFNSGATSCVSTFFVVVVCKTVLD